jgi:hypothetical protein
MSIILNIFTNAAKSAPSTKIIERTFHSFNACFGSIQTFVYMDKNPNIIKAQQYYDNLKNIFHPGNIFVTESLSDGYIKSINNNPGADYAFNLEHDWIFNKDLIKHSLNEIIELMYRKGFYHFRFNKRNNVPAIWDKKMREEMDLTGFRYCFSNNMSNNPHIIDVQKYKSEIMKHIQIKPGSKGIEEELNKAGKYESVLYGSWNYPATVQHLDGRR